MENVDDLPDFYTVVSRHPDCRPLRLEDQVSIGRSIRFELEGDVQPERARLLGSQFQNAKLFFRQRFGWHDADDAIQETMLKQLRQSLAKYDPDALGKVTSFRTFFLRAMYYEALEARRKHETELRCIPRAPVVHSEDQDDYLDVQDCADPYGQDPVQQLIDEEEAATMRGEGGNTRKDFSAAMHALRGKNNRWFKAIAQILLKGMETKVIADEFDVTTACVNKWIHSGLQFLCEHMGVPYDKDNFPLRKMASDARKALRKGAAKSGDE